MENNLLSTLLQASLAAGAALLLVLLLRKPLRLLSGAAIAYQAWLIVPVVTFASLAAALLPMAPVARPLMLESLPAMQAASAAVAVAGTGGIDWAPWLLLGWLAGAAALGIWIALAHKRFLLTVGATVERDGIFHAASAHAGPALIGVWRPRIVVPSDFTSRFTPDEQNLILAHERVHARRGDTAANLACALLQCLFWFNPLVHLGARCFRLDQELACDDAVMREKPALRRSYAQAMLKAQLSGGGSFISCHWQSHHPLKDRIMNLDRLQPRSGRLFAGRAVLATLICLGGYSALAAHASADLAPGAQVYEVEMLIDVGGKQIMQRKYARLDERFEIAVEEAGTKWVGEMLIKPGKDGAIDMQSNVQAGAPGPGTHTLVGALNNRYRLIRHDPKTAAKLDMLVLVTKAPMYEIALQLDVGAKHIEPKLRVQAGEAFAVAVDEADAHWRLDGVLRPLPNRQLDLTTTVTRENTIVAKPRLVFKLDDQAGMGVSDSGSQQSIKMKMKVAQVGSNTPLVAHGGPVQTHENK
ncbi:MAG: M56 family metallopeptidase [Pseudomonadota bacterium]